MEDVRGCGGEDDAWVDNKPYNRNVLQESDAQRLGNLHVSWKKLFFLAMVMGKQQ